MRAVTWHGQRNVSVDEHPDPTIQEPTDAVVRITTTAICGSDLHLYEVLNAYMNDGDILGHEPIGIVEEVGAGVPNLKRGDRVVIPFQISCGGCYMCEHGLFSQCETTQVREHRTGAALFGYSELYGEVPGGQAGYLRVPQAQFTHIKVPEGPPDERLIYLSDVAPTAWQAVSYADVPKGGTLVVFGLGPVGDMCTRVAPFMDVERVIGVDIVPERLRRVASRGIEVLDLTEHDRIGDVIRDMTGGRGPDSVIDAVGMEAHGSGPARMMQLMAAALPDAIAKKLMERAGVDRMGALYTSIDAVRRGGTLSLIGVYGGQSDPMPMMTIFDKQIQIRMGQANVKRWVDDLMPLALDDADPLGLEGFHSHELPLEEAPYAYEIFQKKEDDAVKVLLKP